MKGFSTSRLFGDNSIHSVVPGGVTIIVGTVKAVSASDGVIIVAGLARVSWDDVFLVWDWVVLVFSFVSFSDIIEVSMLVKGVVVSLIGCCCSGWYSFGC